MTNAGDGRAGEVVPAPSRRRLAPRAAPDAVLVLRFSALGDVMLLAPALDALHQAWPTTRIIVGLADAFAPVLTHDPAVADLLPLTKGEGAIAYAGRLQQALSAYHTVAILDLHNSVRSVALRALLPLRWPRSVWQKREFIATVGVGLGLKTWRAERLHADRYHLAVEALVGMTLPRGRFRAFADPDAIAQCRALLAEAGHDPGRPLVGMAPGARWATKRWPAERFAAVAREAIGAGCDVVVQGSADEAGLCAEVTALAGGSLNLSGRLDIAGLLGLMPLCAAFVANDSGPMHIARASGVPTVAIFGSTDPGSFVWEGHRALSVALPCAPCSFYGRATCPEGHLRCLGDIAADTVWDALRSLLLTGPAPRLGG